MSQCWGPLEHGKMAHRLQSRWIIPAAAVCRLTPCAAQQAKGRGFLQPAPGSPRSAQASGQKVTARTPQLPAAANCCLACAPRRSFTCSRRAMQTRCRPWRRCGSARRSTRSLCSGWSMAQAVRLQLPCLRTPLPTVALHAQHQPRLPQSAVRALRACVAAVAHDYLMKSPAGDGHEDRATPVLLSLCCVMAIAVSFGVATGPLTAGLRSAGGGRAAAWGEREQQRAQNSRRESSSRERESSSSEPPQRAAAESSSREQHKEQGREDGRHRQPGTPSGAPYLSLIQ